MKTIYFSLLLFVTSCSVLFPNQYYEEDTATMQALDPSQMPSITENGLPGKLVVSGTTPLQMCKDQKNDFCFFSHTVQQGDAGMSYVGRLDSNGTMDLPDFLAGIQTPSSLTIYKDTLLVCYDQKIFRYDPITAKKLSSWTWSMQEISEWDGMTSLVEGKLYAWNTEHGLIVSIDETNGQCSIIAKIPHISYITCHPISSILAISDRQSISEMDAQGKILRVLDSSIGDICGLVYGKDNCLYAASSKNGKVYKYDSRGKFVGPIVSDLPEIRGICISGEKLWCMRTNQIRLFELSSTTP